MNWLIPHGVVRAIGSVVLLPGCVLTADMGSPDAGVTISITWQGEVSSSAGAKGSIALRSGGILSAHTEHSVNRSVIACYRSDNDGKSWSRLGNIVTVPRGNADVGDGCLLERANGDILYSYRDNPHGPEGPAYAIRIAFSHDKGKTWTSHSTVMDVAPRGDGPSRGLWSSFLLESGGALQCYYDDEYTPWRTGYSGHQWLQMRTWNPAASAWERPVTVSRAHDPRHLSRDGMGSVVVVAPNRQICVLESVRVNPPHTNTVRIVRSDDGGRTWSWTSKERDVLWEPADPRFGSYCPWLCRAADGTLICAFGTNDGGTPDPPATPVPSLHLDVKCVISRDEGKTWSSPIDVARDTHRAYMPGVVEAGTSIRNRHLVFLWLDTVHGFRCRRGVLTGLDPARLPRRHPQENGIALKRRSLSDRRSPSF